MLETASVSGGLVMYVGCGCQLAVSAKTGSSKSR